jgi:hypothetical protein
MTTQLSPEKAVVTEPSFSLELVREAKQSEEFSAAGRTIQPKVVDEDNFQDISFRALLGYTSPNSDAFQQGALQVTPAYLKALSGRPRLVHGGKHFPPEIGVDDQCL